jgi:DNA-directed RNA polymerase specialized sigma24 family protein
MSGDLLIWTSAFTQPAIITEACSECDCCCNFALLNYGRSLSVISFMRKGWSLTQEAFDLLLEWLSPDRENAGEIYEEIRNGLVKLFLIRGCRHPEILADETINRVTSKVSGLIREYQGNPAHYFYNIAGKVYLESLSPRKNNEEQLDLTSLEKAFAASPEPADADAKLEYLKECLQKLSAENRELVTEYFAADKSEKIEHRRMLSEKKGVSLNTLRIKVMRLKRKLHDCVFKKLKDK